MLDGLLINADVAHQLTRVAALQSATIIIAGPKGVGKATIARRLGVARAGERQADASITVLGDGMASISIAETRELIASLALRAHSAARRTVIIDGADLLTTEAQNALLKTLEEPPDDCLIVLVAEDPERLLPTVRSRAMQLTVGRQRVDVLTGFLKRAYPDTSLSHEQAARLSGGAPGWAVLLLTNSGTLAQAIEAEATIRSALGYDRLEALRQASRLSEDPLLSTMTTQALAIYLGDEATELALGVRLRAIRALEHFQHRRHANVPLKPSLEGLFLELRHG